VTTSLESGEQRKEQAALAEKPRRIYSRSMKDKDLPVHLSPLSVVAHQTQRHFEALQATLQRTDEAALEVVE